MAKGKEISVEIRKLIVDHHRNGQTNAELSRIFKIHKSTVSSIIQRWRKGLGFKNQVRCGRPRVTSAVTDRRIINIVKKNRFASTTEIRAMLKDVDGKLLNKYTIRNRLIENGYRGRVPRRKPNLVSRHVKQRLSWAESHADWTINDWKKVLFSDESKIELFNNDGPQKCWRKQGEAFNPKCILPTVKHGGGSIMVWGCFNFKGVGGIEIINGTMDSNMYIDILKKHLKKSARKFRLGKNFVFQQDNDRKHTARITQDFFTKNGIQVLDWASQSPDMNPIEHLWVHLKLAVKKRQPTSIRQLEKVVIEEWEKIPSAITNKLVESMVRRVAALKAAKGFSTKY